MTYEELSRSIARLGRAPETPGLDRDELEPSPMAQFAKWMGAALEAGCELPNTMTLATAGVDAAPSARIVLLKGFDDSGFVFYTNYESRKGRELEMNPHAALVFYWQPLARQVGVTGSVTKVPAAESDAYFDSRPYASQLGAWASRQSAVVEDRSVVEGRMRDLESRYPEGSVPRPPYWGGFRLTPMTVEFWQGRPNRLHDRFRYSRSSTDGWTIERLSP